MAKRTQRFTLEPCRAIFFDGKPYLGICNDGAGPVNTDEMARLIVKLLNSSRAAHTLAVHGWKPKP